MKALPVREADEVRGKEIILNLRKFGITKLNFVGGEPLLHPCLKELAAYAKEIGLTVSIVTNGYLLSEKRLHELRPVVDWIGVSIDSANEEVEARLGRGSGKHVENTLRVCSDIRANGIKLKINTVVTNLNFNEDMRPLIAELHPLRWKVFQMLDIEGQNEHYFAELEASNEEFEIFKRLNSDILLESSYYPVFESADDMVDSYLMLAPDGRVIQNTNHTYIYHSLEKALDSDLSGIVNKARYLERGGKYDWQ
jgi:radical S-adenosyl methionine domain-containing protein 2